VVKHPVSLNAISESEVHNRNRPFVSRLCYGTSESELIMLNIGAGNDCNKLNS